MAGSQGLCPLGRPLTLAGLSRWRAHPEAGAGGWPCACGASWNAGPGLRGVMVRAGPGHPGRTAAVSHEQWVSAAPVLEPEAPHQVAQSCAPSRGSREGPPVPPPRPLLVAPGIRALVPGCCSPGLIPAGLPRPSSPPMRMLAPADPLSVLISAVSAHTLLLPYKSQAEVQGGSGGMNQCRGECRTPVTCTCVPPESPTCPLCWFLGLKPENRSGLKPQSSR